MKWLTTRVANRAWVGPLAALVVTWCAFALLAPSTFPRPANAITMARQTAVIAIAAVGMTPVIISGGIDLSVGSVVAFTTVVIAAALRAGFGPGAAVLAGLAAGTASGLLSGVLVGRMRMAPFIVTLGSMSILRGAAKGLASEQKIDCDPRGLDALLSPASGWPLVPPASGWRRSWAWWARPRSPTRASVVTCMPLGATRRPLSSAVSTSRA